MSTPRRDGGLALDQRGPLALGCASLAKRALLLPRSSRLLEAELAPPGPDQPAVCYLGEGESLAYLAKLHGNADPLARGISPLALHRRLVARARRQLAYFEVNRLVAGSLLGWALRPAAVSHPWISQAIVLRSGRRPGKAFEGVYGRRVRKHQLSYSLTRDPTQVTRFYREHYQPYVSSRFAETAHPRAEAELQAAVRAGFLLQVLGPTDEWLGGVVCRLGGRLAGRGVTALAYGLRRPHRELLAIGALSAASYFLVRWAREQGLGRVELLRSRPHQRDGVFEHKRRLGAEARWDPWPHTAICIYPPTEAALPEVARGLLVRHRWARAAPLGEVLVGRR